MIFNAVYNPRAKFEKATDEEKAIFETDIDCLKIRWTIASQIYSNGNYPLSYNASIVILNFINSKRLKAQFDSSLEILNDLHELATKITDRGILVLAITNLKEMYEISN